MKAKPLVSLILVTYESRNLLQAFLQALAQTTYPHYELIVVDNASADGTVAFLQQEQPEVVVVANAENLGFGRACNLGAQAARGDLLLFLNPDVIVTPDWLSILVEDITAHPELAILCPTTLYPDQQASRADTDVQLLATVPGAALMVRRKAWEDLGGFDEHMFLYWEDTELCWRAWLLGWHVAQDLRALVYHERGASTRGRRWDAELIKNSLYTYLKLMRWRRVIPFALILLAKTLTKVILLRWPGLLRAWGWNIEHLRRTLQLRRSVLQQRRTDFRQLEQLIVLQNRRLRRERRERRERARQHRSTKRGTEA